MARKQVPQQVSDQAEESFDPAIDQEDDTLTGLSPLYDFLYRDQARIDSYYAQMFAGRLRSSEKTSSKRDADEGLLKGSVTIVGAEHKSTNEVATSTRTVVDPHDLTLIDVLSFLQDNGCIDADFDSAPNGRMVSAAGRLFFMDHSIVKVGMAAANSTGTPHKGMSQIERDAANTVKLAQAVLKEITIPSSFVLHSRDGLNVGGTVKEAGMEEPINTYYFRHGAAGLDDVVVIGIKELVQEDFIAQGSHLLSVMLPMATAMQGLLFPVDTVRITPVAIFRVVEQTRPL